MEEAAHLKKPGPWLFHDHHVILDTRSPAEFEKGHITGAISFPLFENDERATIGTLYKQQGKQAAVSLGLEFVGPKMAQLVEQARKLFEDQQVRRPLVIHCWRGGMRSGSVAWLLETAGIDVIKLEGGYKAYREWARTDFASILDLRILGGMTGVGKTKILKAMRNLGAQTIDLEGLAGHLGSAFGNLERTPQPTSEQFGNDCHRQLAALNGKQPIWMENESRTIGKVHQPESLFNALRIAPVWAVGRTIEERVEELCQVYGEADLNALKAAFGRIREKLGGLKWQEAMDALERSDLQTAAAIGLLYYDKLYRHTKKRYPRAKYIEVDCAGLDFEDAAKLVLKSSSRH
ncbi:MAG: tRNA 2-selenouridine(34) synthase MnmH [Bacteroidetes bacterium]|nr:tRNA 2-selenouridine(34) synthase MnmH [Bacteroidota bacterium]MDA1335602.1 tRNA 2-selenouridine(34) synthase MnmH [Bacteroidota bacterium]